MMTPNLNLEPENNSEDSSQVASNISLQEPSPDLTKGSTTTSSCLTNITKDKEEGDPASLTLDLTLNFNPGDASSEVGPEPHGSASATPRVFSCNYCRRKFFSSQALGGPPKCSQKGEDNGGRAMRMGMFTERYTSLASLPLHGSPFRSLGIEAHAAMHQRHVPSVRAPDMRAAAKFEKSHFGSVVLMEDDDVGFFWPGSYRQVDNQGHAQTSKNASIVPTSAPNNPPQAPSTSPDLTLKL